jgi:hypothetical protein
LMDRFGLAQKLLDLIAWLNIGSRCLGAEAA